MPFATAEGITLNYRIDGDDGLPLLVLSNGLGTELSRWDAQTPVLTRAFRVLRYDTRGHGASPTPSQSFSIEHLGRDVLALLDRAGVARAHFCSNAAVARWFTPDFIARQPGAVAEVQVAMERTSAEGYVRCCAAVRDADFRETIVRIRTPLLVISGADDVATPPADGLDLAQRIAGSRSLTFDTAHLSNIESPHEFSEAVGSFCQTECAKS